MVVPQRLLEFRAVHDVVVALPPRRAVRLVVDRNRLQLGVVVSQVDDDLRDARFEVGNCV